MKFSKTLLCICILFITAAAKLHAQSSDDLKRRLNKYTEELNQLNHEYEETANNKRSTLKQLNLLKAQINLREEKISAINAQVHQLDNQIYESNNTIHNLQNQLTQLKNEYAAMIQFAYRNKSSYNKLEFIFAAKDFNQAYKRMKYLQQFAAYRERQAQYIEETEKDLGVKINELDNTKKQKNSLLVDQVKEKETLGKQRKDQVKVINDLSRQQGELKQQQISLRRKIARTNQEIAAAIKREIEEERRKEAANSKNVTNPSNGKSLNKTDNEVLNATPEAIKLSNDFLGNRGHLPWPVTNGVVVQGFGVYYEEGIKNDNPGIDIKTNEDAPVRAVFDGQVKSINNVYGSYFVVIKHGEYFTAYSNLKSVSVVKNQHVSTKQNIGVAAIESSSGIPKIGFQLWKGATPVDPRLWLQPD
ncbi:MAG TPA: peptidoglycan DD-metalloendopeptidase family protein [Mucilaginibacter sp.]|nr:peptidoglycan DD-metalloendopeptidase family protein [Mucilaginibacter sp.]